eukprot:5966200-Pyramimonas_sp.AAC.1
MSVWTRSRRGGTRLATVGRPRVLTAPVHRLTSGLVFTPAGSRNVAKTNRPDGAFGLGFRAPPETSGGRIVFPLTTSDHK